MKQGKDLLETITKWLFFIIFAIMIIGIFIPEGKGLPMMFVAMLIFFIFPFTESLVTLYYKWFYRNIQVGEGPHDEESGMWETIKIHILNVIPFEELPKILHDSYIKSIDTYYKEQIRDKTIENVNKRFTIDEKTLELTSTKKIDYDELAEMEDKQKLTKTIEYTREEEEDEDE